MPVLGILKETKIAEGRVALVPADAARLIQAGARVFIERGAGERAGFPDASYVAIGASLASDAKQLIASAEVVVKVKEPTLSEIDALRSGQLFMSYLHLAAFQDLIPPLLHSQVTALGFETITEHERHPVLEPMSAVAGILSLQIGEHYLEATSGGRGVLLPGIRGEHAGKVVIVGSGVVGEACGRLAHALGARVTFVDRDASRLTDLAAAYPHACCVQAEPELLTHELEDSDLVVGAVYITGARAPHVVTRSMIAAMPQHSVAIDVAIDQGGCFETSRPTTHDQPVYEDAGVVHYCVTNIPAMVPHTASLALSQALTPYLELIVREGVRGALANQASLSGAINIQDGRITHPSLLAEAAPSGRSS